MSYKLYIGLRPVFLVCFINVVYGLSVLIGFSCFFFNLLSFLSISFICFYCLYCFSIAFVYVVYKCSSCSRLFTFCSQFSFIVFSCVCGIALAVLNVVIVFCCVCLFLYVLVFGFRWCFCLRWYIGCQGLYRFCFYVRWMFFCSFVLFLLQFVLIAFCICVLWLLYVVCSFNVFSDTRMLMFGVVVTCLRFLFCSSYVCVVCCLFFFTCFVWFCCFCLFWFYGVWFLLFVGCFLCYGFSFCVLFCICFSSFVFVGLSLCFKVSSLFHKCLMPYCCYLFFVCFRFSWFLVVVYLFVLFL